MIAGDLNVTCKSQLRILKIAGQQTKNNSIKKGVIMTNKETAPAYEITVELDA